MKIKLVLDINKTQQAQLNAVVTGRQGDKATVTVNVFVVDGGVPYNLTGNTIYYEGLKPNNAYVRDTSGVKIINATQGNFEYTFRPETFGVAGIGKRSYFSIEQGGTVRASTQDFGLITLADAMTGNAMSGTYISELEELINLAQWLVDDINSRWTSINTQLTQLQNKLNTMDVVKRSGDTMTGNLLLTGASNISQRFKAGTGAQVGWEAFTDGKFRLFDWTNSRIILNYDPATDMIDISRGTNVVKKAGDTITGDLHVQNAKAIRFKNSANDNTPLYMGASSNGNFNMWSDVTSKTVMTYDPSVDTFEYKSPVKFSKDGRVTLTLTADATNPVTTNPPRATRRGNTVTVQGSIRRNTGSTSNIVTTLPADMKPTQDSNITAVATDGSAVDVFIGANSGNISIGTADKHIQVFATYVVD